MIKIPKYCIYRITNKINDNSYIGQHKYTNETNHMDKTDWISGWYHPLNNSLKND